MKKLLPFVSALLAVFCVFPTFAFAEEVQCSEQYYEQPVGVIVETVEGSLLSEYEFSNRMLYRAMGNVDLSSGGDYLIAGRLSAGSTFNTNIYAITKSSIRLALESHNAPSDHLKVNLYKSDGTLVAAKTISVPTFNVASPMTTYVTFTNLHTAYNYYAVISNVDTVQSGELYVGVTQR